MPTDSILSAASLTLFVIAATREVRKRWSAIDGLFVWVAAAAIGVAVSFVAAALLGPVEWRAAVLRGLGFAVAAVGAVGTKKALVDPAKPTAAPAATVVLPVDSASPTVPVAPSVTEDPGMAREPQLDFNDARPSNR